MPDFHDEHKVCMELIKQKSREVSETDILLTAMKDLLQNCKKRKKR